MGDASLADDAAASTAEAAASARSGAMGSLAATFGWLADDATVGASVGAEAVAAAACATCGRRVGVATEGCAATATFGASSSSVRT